MMSKRSWRNLHGDLGAARKPIVIGAERQSEFLVVDPQIAVAAARHRIRHHALHFLRHYADIGLAAAKIAEAVIAEAIGEMAKQDDIMLQRDVGTTPTATTAAEAAASSAAAEAATASTSAAEATSSTRKCRATAAAARHARHARPPARGCRRRRPAGRHIHRAAAI